MDPREVEIDNQLRRSLDAPIPTLSADFDQRLMADLSQRSRALSRFGKIWITGYTVMSVAVCALIMHDQGLDWPPIAALILIPLAIAAGAPYLRRRPASAKLAQ